jgi:glycosyltransferase involved in cell wall biosynthesis
MWRQVMTPGLARLGEVLELRVAPRLYQRARVLTPSSSSRAHIIERLGLPPANVTAIPNGVDDRFCPGGGKAPHPRIATVGRLVVHKHVDRLIAVAAAVRRTVPDLELDIVGQGYERPNIERVINDFDARDWVHLHGHVSDDQLVDILRSAWVIASTSSDEGWGLSLTEAAACGTPAVATRVAGHVDSVRDGDTGILAHTDDELAGALEAVLTDQGLRTRLGAAAQRWAESLTWDHAALEVIRAIAEGPIA